MIENRTQFENWMSIMNIGAIKRLKGKLLAASFAVVIAGTSKAYVWKAESVQLRDEWVTELRSHQKVLMSMLDQQKESKMKKLSKKRRS